MTTPARSERSPSLWVIDPSVHHPEDQGVREVLEGWPGRSRVFHPARNGDGPAPGTGYDAQGVVLLGSAESVHEPLPWMERLAAWLDPVLEGHRRCSLLGICFGHQLIAHRRGGRIGFLQPDRSKLVGVEASELEGGRLIRGRQSLSVVVSHREEVKRKPPGYRVVARRGSVACDGLEHETLPIFSFQFHPEARDDFARHAGIDPAAIDGRVREDSQRLLGAFRRHVLER